MRIVTKLEKNSSKLELLNKKTAAVYFVVTVSLDNSW